ncbi:hypothetical protein [Virgibacillus sp. YIM 98842]|uniref:hypothetical protein n=1 Tax=Virgibacillus sp. YIM 98842 TaxID=2663533 RepID=UPI0013D90C5E|nr:hypothetical protein [Virgibacillus sp. YIM 98842]
MDINHYLKTFQKKKGALAQSECLRQAPRLIKELYTNHYIGKEKEFLALLLYIQEHNNLDRVMEAVKELNAIRFGYVTTERILFICDQSSHQKESTPLGRDEVIEQSESNMEAYANMVQQVEEGVTHCG